MNDLKPCPFCGGEGKICGSFGSSKTYVFCDFCEAKTGYGYEQHVISAWNRRDGGGDLNGGLLLFSAEEFDQTKRETECNLCRGVHFIQGTATSNNGCFHDEERDPKGHYCEFNYCPNCGKKLMA